MRDVRTRVRRRRPFGNIRARTTAAATVVLGLALVLTSIVMVTFVERSLVSSEADQAEVRARQIASHPIPTGSPIPVNGADDEFVQVLQGGRVVASSANVASLRPLASPRPGQRVRLGAVPFAEGPFVAVARSTTAGSVARTVVVGRSVDDAIEARSTVAHALAFGVPVLLALVASVTWRIVGRALRPVEDLRSEVDRISSRELHRRVPDPPGDDEIARLAATMNRMLDRLERSQHRLRQFVSDASHELRSPVASIRQEAEVASAHPAWTTVAQLARDVLEDDARLERLVDDLLLLARLEESAPRADDEVDLDDVVLAEAARMRAVAPVEVDTRLVSPGRVRGDPAHLERLVRNIAENAARHATARTSIALSTLDRDVVLAVDDDGPGIPEEDRDRVFERFVRLDGARSRGTGGAGLGLSIVREIALAHRGTVTLGESRLGGLRVEVRLPAAG